MIERRAFIVGGVAALTAPLGVEAQQTAGKPKIGYLTPSSPRGGTAGINAFRDGLRKHGYLDGTDIVIEPRFSDGYERVPVLLAELLNLNIAVLVVATTPVALAAQKATNTVPIVFAPVADPVGSGLVASLARPGGNITGYSDIATGLAQKRLALLSEAVARMSRVGVVRHADNPGSRIAIEELEAAARLSGLKIYQAEVRHTDDLEPAFATLAKAPVHALIAVADLHLTEYVATIAGLAIKRRLPLMGFGLRWSQAGALLSYGSGTGTPAEFSRHAAAYVVKILHGAKPADLPIEQPTRFDLIINLATARILNLTIPPSLLLRADQVIE